MIATRILMTMAMATTLAATGCRRPAEDKSPPAPSSGAVGSDPAPRASASTYRYLWSKSCAGCHPRHYDEWKSSLHAQAHTDPVYDFYFMRASRDSNKKLEPFCGRCHTPLAVRSGEIPFKKTLRVAGDTRVSKVAREGIQCDVCHTIDAVPRTNNGGFHLQPSNVKHGPLADAKPINHLAKGNPLYRRAEYCGACHDVVHPTNGIHLETTYSEWKKGPYAKKGIVCQDCHMTSGLVPPVAYKADAIGRQPRHAGKAAAMGKPRPHISKHLFVGPNLIFTEPKARAERAARESLLRRAGRVAIRGLTRRDGHAGLDLRVSNTGAGHYLPTGVTELRELWLQITVRDAAGKVVFRDGHPDAKGLLPKKATVYRTVVHDAKGRDTTLFWNTVKKVSDRRIPPLGHLDERIQLPASVKGALTVEVALNYRSVSPAGLAEAGVPVGSIPIPIFTIHSVKKTLTL